MLTTSFNQDVPQEVVRRILDHDSSQMTGHYARLHDTTVRRHWEAARKVSITAQTVTLDPDGAAGRSRVGQTASGPGHPGPAERFLRAAGAEDLPACERVLL